MAGASLSPSFLGSPIEICIVTRSHKRTLANLSALGIGPWRIYTCSPSNTLHQTYLGQPTPFTLRFCYASLPPSGITYEVIEPVSGPTIFQSFLDEKGEGIHHVAYDCNGVGMEERLKGFKERGWNCTQGGTWKVGGMNSFAFFEREGAETCFETIDFEEGWDWPEPEEWFPAPPTAEQDRVVERSKGAENEERKE